MRGLAGEREFRTDRGIILQAVTRHRVRTDVQQQRSIDILEVAGAHEKRPADELLFCRAERDHDRAGNIEPLHRLFHRECCARWQRRRGCCGLPYARARPRSSACASIEPGVCDPSGSASISVTIAITGLPVPHFAAHVGRHACTADFHRETAGFEHVLQEVSCFRTPASRVRQSRKWHRQLSPWFQRYDRLPDWQIPWRHLPPQLFTETSSAAIVIARYGTHLRPHRWKVVQHDQPVRAQVRDSRHMRRLGIQCLWTTSGFQN